jgi:hypothetical protein
VVAVDEITAEPQRSIEYLGAHIVEDVDVIIRRDVAQVRTGARAAARPVLAPYPR